MDMYSTLYFSNGKYILNSSVLLFNSFNERDPHCDSRRALPAISLSSIITI